MSDTKSAAPSARGISDPRVFLDGRVTLHPGDCLAVLRTMPDECVDSVATDPPYHLTSIVKRFGGANASPAKTKQTGAFTRASRGFMGKTWDGGDIAFRVELWVEVLRVLKPGGHLVAFSGTRTYHRMACAIEDAGFEIRDQNKFDHEGSAAVRAFVESLNAEQAAQFAKLFGEDDSLGQLAWVYGSGFPKSHDVSKAIHRMAGAERQVVSTGRAVKRMIPVADQNADGSWIKDNGREFVPTVTAPATDAARQWAGWGTAQKPAWEPICLARKPLIGTVAENVLAHGVGALNIDGCRVEGKGNRTFDRTAGDRSREQYRTGTIEPGSGRVIDIGRFPANVLHDGSPEVLAAFPWAPGQSGAMTGAEPSTGDRYILSGLAGNHAPRLPRNDAGSAARFFYTAKADADDRLGSKHPTVKPVDLMQWLVRLVTPKGGTVLDIFAGTGTTGEAAWREGCNAILIERETEYLADIARRMDLVLAGPGTRRGARAKPSDDHGPLFILPEAAE